MKEIGDLPHKSPQANIMRTEAVPKPSESLGIFEAYGVFTRWAGFAGKILIREQGTRSCES